MAVWEVRERGSHDDGVLVELGKVVSRGASGQQALEPVVNVLEIAPALPQVRVGETPQTFEEATGDPAQGPVGVDPLVAHELLDLAHERGIVEQQEVRVEDRGVGLAEVPRQAPAERAKLLGGQPAGLPGALDLPLLVSRGQAEPEDAPLRSLEQEGGAEGDARRHPDPPEDQVGPRGH